jgi:hypothetical protein
MSAKQRWLEAEERREDNSVFSLFFIFLIYFYFIEFLFFYSDFRDYVSTIEFFISELKNITSFLVLLLCSWREIIFSVFKII